MSKDTFTHQELVKRGVGWLKRQASNNGPGCTIALSEIASGYGGEIPDCIGWRYTQDPFDGSSLIEVKVSRSDFLADRKKPHRNGEVVGVGKFRYYLCPWGMIDPDELPDKWGLIYAKGKRQLKVIKGAAASKHYGDRIKDHETFAFEVDYAREQFILTRLFAKVGDPEEYKARLNKGYRAQTSLQGQVDKLRRELKETSAELWRAKQELGERCDRQQVRKIRQMTGG